MSLKNKFIIDKSITGSKQPKSENSFDQEMLDWLFENIPNGAKILQIGNLKFSSELVQKYDLTGIIYGKKSIKILNCNYIHCSIINYEVFMPSDSSSDNHGNKAFNLRHFQYSWFDLNELVTKLDQNYDLILVDGPSFKVGRMGIAYNLNIFNKSASFLFNKSHTFSVLSAVKSISTSLHRPFETYECASGKRFSVIR